MRLIINLGIGLIISIAIIASILIILIRIEKKLRGEIKEMDPNKDYVSQIKQISKSNYKKIPEQIDKITRNFFREAFGIRAFTGYSELTKFFKRKKDAMAVEFCELMSTILYSKEKDNDEIQRLINILIEIIQTNKIIYKEEQITPEK